MAENKKTSVNDKNIEKNRRIVIISVSVLLALVLLFGAVIGTINIVKRARAVVMYSGVTLDVGVVNYMASTYKGVYMQQIGAAYDTPEFWDTHPDGSSKTYGELLTEKTEKYIRSVAVGAYLFDRYTRLSSGERDAIERATGEILDFVADNSEDKFNKDCKAMGFDYSDFCRATEIIYKSEQAKAVIYGYEGAALSGGNMLAECDDYFNEFARVKILYIPTRVDLKRDKDGKFELDSEGKYAVEFFTPAEISERNTDIDRIRELIDGLKNGADEQMSPEYFDAMQEKYNYSSLYNESGYYFSPYSEYTAKFAEVSSELLPDGYREALYKYLSSVVEEGVFSLSEGQYGEFEGDYGVCFIYKCQKENYAYLSNSYVDFFHDFYSDAADYLYAKSVDKISEDVTLKDSYFEIDVIALPYNCDYIAKVEE